MDAARHDFFRQARTLKHQLGALLAIGLLVRDNGAWWQYLVVIVAVATPVLGFYGGKDRGIPQKDIDDIVAAAKAAGKQAEVIVYPDAQHGFLADYRQSYDATSSADAWGKCLAFFKKNGVA